MASKQEQYFDDLINFKKTIEFLSDSFESQDDVFKLMELRDSFILWLSHIKEDKKFNKIRFFKPAGSIISDHIKNGGVNTRNRYIEVKALLEKNIDLYIEFFNKLEVSSNLTDKILIKIYEERKEVSTESKGKILKYLFRKSDGISKRFEYLFKIAQNPKVGAKKLSATSYQNISSEISEINKNIKEALKLKKDLIVNEGNSGYQINDPYEIDFI